LSISSSTSRTRWPHVRVIAHDLTMSSTSATDHVMYRGEIVEQGPANVVFEHPENPTPSPSRKLPTSGRSTVKPRGGRSRLRAVTSRNLDDICGLGRALGVGELLQRGRNSQARSSSRTPPTSVRPSPFCHLCRVGPRKTEASRICVRLTGHGLQCCASTTAAMGSAKVSKPAPSSRTDRRHPSPSISGGHPRSIRRELPC